MPLVLGRARRSGRGATGGADHIRSSLSVVLTDAAPVSTAAVASSRPREHPEGPPSAWSVVGGCYIKNWVQIPLHSKRGSSCWAADHSPFSRPSWITP